MGFRFRRSIRLFPGVRVNLGKRGASLSVGVKGAHITVGHGQTRETVGLPGSGLSYTAVQTKHEALGAAQPAQAAKHGRFYLLGVALFAVLIVWAIVATYRAQP